MRLAVVAAGFTPGEADQLRRAMGAWRRPGLIDEFRRKLIDGMLASGMPREYAEATFQQIRGFGDYGFPESHAASFALLVYVSAWLKHHYGAAFTAALLNSQPMGFYAPAQLVRNAREHGVEVRPVDVNRSNWESTLEPREAGTDGRHGDLAGAPETASRFALRLGFQMIGGLRAAHAERIEQVRGKRPFGSLDDFSRRTGLGRSVATRLAKAGTFRSLGLDRRGALWEALAENEKKLPLFDSLESDAGPQERDPSGKGEDGEVLKEGLVRCTHPTGVKLPKMSAAEEVLADYRTTGLSLSAHPMQFLRPGLDEMKVAPAGQLKSLPNGGPVTVAGIVLVRQRPGTAKGITFVTLEDETGTANLIIRPDVWKRYRQAALGATILLARGRLQRHDLVIHVLVRSLENLSGRLNELGPRSRDFC